MNKYFKKMFVLMCITISLVLLIPFLVLAGEEAMTAYGYQITLVKYFGSGTPEVVGKPILVYHPDLFADVFRHISVSMPGSYDSFVSSSWGLRQIIDRDKDWTHNGDAPSELMPDIKNPSTSGHDVIAEDEFGNEFTIGDRYYYTHDGSQENAQAAQTICSSSPGGGGSTGYTILYQKFMSQDRKVTYKASDITNLNDFYAVYPDSKLTEYNVKNNGYLDSLIKDKYFKNVQSIKQYFGIDINYSEIDKYYVSVEPVQRVLDGIARTQGSYLAQTISKTIKENSTWTSASWSKGTCCHRKSYKQKMSAKDCTMNNGTYSNGYCTYQGACDKWNYSLPFQPNGIKNFFYIYGRYADGYSHIATSRSLNSSSTYLNRAVNYCNNTDNKHCELENDNVTCKKDSKGNILYQYYVGPSLDKALVGTTTQNYFLLNGSCSDGVSGRKETGIKHYYLVDLISCKNTCETHIGDKSSDEYLKCAENYCDAEVDFNLKGSPRKRKKDCILSCGYTYGKSPTDGTTTNKNRESVNSCNNSNPYNRIEKANVLVSTTSSCSIDKLTGDDLSKTNAIITSCSGDQITDFDGIENDTPFDLRTYINVSCKETSSFSFSDLTNRRLVAGEGIDYQARLNAQKECTVYFNLEQWKFDYATISSKDPDRRKRLLYIYDVYNNALDKSYDRTKSPYYDPDFLKEGYGEVEWTDYEYNTDKVKVISRVREIVNNLVEISDKYNLVIGASDDSLNTTIIKKENITQIYNMNLSYKPVNRYLQVSDKQVYYMFDKYCVTTDGKATVFKAPDNGVCYTSNGVKVLGMNLYYTNLNATSNRNFSDSIIKQGVGHEVMTDANIGRETPNTDVYYEDGESCPYKIDDDNLGCTIIIKAADGTVMHGNDIYVYGDVDASIKINEKLGAKDSVLNFGLVKGTIPEANGVDTITVGIGDKKNGVEEIQLSGIVESKNGSSAMCKKRIYIINPSDKCGVSCSVERDKNNNTLYEIKSTGKQTPKQYLTALSTNMNFVVVLPTIGDNRYLVRLNKEVGNTFDSNGNVLYDKTIVYGKVEGKMTDTGETCYNVCWSDVPDLPNCTEEYKPSETGEIKNYCTKYWNSDINNYDGVSDCVNQCSTARMCGSDRRNYTEVETVCKNNYTTWGFKNASGCVNYCYYCPECESGYIFRPVNNYNPFPNSSDSNTLGYNYATGNRIIGSNWIGKSEYIKKDDKDSSSVTGVNANQKVEYVIELTPSVIKQIRNDTDSYNKASGGNDAYLDYVYMEGTDTTKRYYSKFINETFKDYFTVIDGESK